MSRKNPTSFSLFVPTKKFLVKYLYSLYGMPIAYTTDNYFGIMITGLLERPARLHHSGEEIRQRFDKLDGKIEIQLPLWWLKKYEAGYSISEKHSIALTKLFENRFEEELYMFVKLMVMTGQKSKDALYAFCDYYSIELDIDITYDCLAKKYNRQKQKTEKIPPGCRPAKENILTAASRKKLWLDLTSLQHKPFESHCPFPADYPAIVLQEECIKPVTKD